MKAGLHDLWQRQRRDLHGGEAAAAGPRADHLLGLGGVHRAEGRLLLRRPEVAFRCAHFTKWDRILRNFSKLSSHFGEM